MSEHIDPGQVTALWASARTHDLLDGLDDDTVPAYGSAAWLELDATDPRRAAALLAAAEAWRRQEAQQDRLDRLADEDPDAWYDEVFGDAIEETGRIARRVDLATMLDRVRAEADARNARKPTPVVARPGWSVAIPGRPGWWRHCIDGRQVDLPRRRPEQSGAAA
ncbi:hypothetical protein [Streptomyces alkaliphilus]|uniref:hypothetical protein n=1 Tax=Streptomyces alkaliphilus TaxID=1472722 RepID=UPI0015FE5C4F|nr:hypothetical protein [Streptomyces alkaliphilus]